MKKPTHIKWITYKDERCNVSEHDIQVMCEYIDKICEKLPNLNGHYNCQGKYVIDKN